MQKPEYLRQLNKEQYSAVTLPAEPALVLAGAGSGKTKVLTSRIAWLLQTAQITPANILAVTFTNKAAKEMLQRLTQLLPFDLRSMWIGTFHGICNRILRLHHQEAGLPAAFQILDSQDQLSALKRLLKSLGIDTSDEELAAKKMQRFINKRKEDGLRPSDLSAHDKLGTKKIEIYELYQQQCQKEGVVDFAELMLRCYELLRDNNRLRQHYQQRFSHILIDEFQDTNKLQYLWLKLLAGFNEVPNPNLFAVGDDDQSIYAFRGARVSNMADFLREFKVRHQIKLEQNYRSHGNILTCANALIGHNKNRLGKNLRTSFGDGEPVRIYQANRDFDETAWLVEEITNLVANDGFKFSQIAVLYRSNAQSRIVESAFFQARIPYKVYGGLRFFERAEIKHALAYLRLIDNLADDTSFLRVVNFPARGIGSRSVEKLQDAAATHGMSLAQAVELLDDRTQKVFARFLTLITELQQRSQNLTLKETIELVLAQSGLLEHYQARKEDSDRVENLYELVNAGEVFTPTAWVAENSVEGFAAEELSPLSAFLSHAALEAGEYQTQNDNEAVQLMTVHAAKGLEFEVVFITGLEERLFPHEQSFYEANGLEEERRLMYVAITRAKLRLYLSYAQQRMLNGQTRYNKRSQFIDELPLDSVKWLTAAKQSFFSTYDDTYTVPSSQHYTSAAKFSVADNAVASTTGAANGDIVRGSKVFHSKFGEGKVLAVEGKGAAAKAKINFRRYGEKWLALEVANLTLVDE